MSFSAASQAGTCDRHADPDTVAERYQIHSVRDEGCPQRLVVLRLRERVQGPTGILKARAVEDRLLADTWPQPSYDLMPRLASLPIPTLVLWGDRDFIPREISEHLVGSLPAVSSRPRDDCQHPVVVGEEVGGRSARSGRACCVNI